MSINDQTSPLIERIFLFLEDGEWSKANEYCEKVLDIDPKNGYAYLGKLMIDYHIKCKNDFINCKKDFTLNTNYKRILQYGDTNLTTEVQSYLSKIKNRQLNENIQRQEAAAKTKEKSIKIIHVALPILLVVTIIILLCFSFLPLNKNNDIDKPQLDVLDYKGLTIKIPYSDEYTIKISNEKIYLSGDIDFTINDFLSFIYAPSGKSFYATGWAANNGTASFLIKDFATVHTLYWLNDPGRNETVDLQFYGYNREFKARYACKDGRWPMYYTGTGPFISPRFENDGTKKYDFKPGETIILGQYRSPATTVEIIVVKQ